MPTLELRPAVAGDVEQMATLHVSASRQAYAGLMPEQVLRAITTAERARRWAQALATIGLDEAIIVGVSETRIVGLGHCGPQRMPTLPYPGEFFCVYVAPEAQRHGGSRDEMRPMTLETARQRVQRISDHDHAWVIEAQKFAHRAFDRARSPS